MQHASQDIHHKMPEKINATIRYLAVKNRFFDHENGCMHIVCNCKTLKEVLMEWNSRDACNLKQLQYMYISESITTPQSGLY